MKEEGIHLLVPNQPHALKQNFRKFWRFVRVGGSLVVAIGLATIVCAQKSLSSINSIESYKRQTSGAKEALHGLNGRLVLAEQADSYVWSTIWTQLKNQERIAAENDIIPFTISYTNNKNIENGAFVPVKLAQEAPTLSFGPETSEWTKTEYFTWIMIDISAPDPAEPKNAPFLHYIVNNLNAVSSTAPIVDVAYYPVSPPRGVHRYFSILFLQQKRYQRETSEADTKEKSISRKNFNVTDYAAQDNLVLYGLLEFSSSPER
uniref:Uncharacterized protein AlNc14C145G7360 n=1 Tax=Albugo laibachii Nc14 TaxID=890382 RepID=F0WLH3_9STRA|nr:conserved hypothetical protein [Albugo laibachii Nc14]|eukprot:CCA22136.1 conserved hypothetical protein [Albugo laibachii Nc14]